MPFDNLLSLKGFSGFLFQGSLRILVITRTDSKRSLKKFGFRVVSHLVLTPIGSRVIGGSCRKMTRDAVSIGKSRAVPADGWAPAFYDLVV